MFSKQFKSKISYIDDHNIDDDMKEFTITKLRRKPKQVYAAAELEPVVITRYGIASFVLMGSQYYLEHFSQNLED